ncbi:MAG: hypothetical protein SVS15_08170, partial [Thermodesulfobacteriota bacterium]|nr:hypothetical protein [Thermodesulfobacteriota bacterium]
MHVLIESMSGFKAALQAGRGRDDSWSTTSALVAETLGREGFSVGWLDDFLAPGVPDAVGFAALDAVAALGPLFEDAGRRQGLPEAIHYAAMPLQRTLSSLMYKQAVLAAWRAKTDGQRLVVGNPVLTPPRGGSLGVDRFDTLLAVFAAKEPDLEVLAEPASDHSALYDEIDRMPLADRLLSLSDISLSQLVYRALRYLGRGKTLRLGSKGPVVRVFKENELVREVLPRLLFNGAGVRIEPPLSGQKPEDSPLPGLPGEDDVAKAVAQAAHARGLDQDFGLAAGVAAERLAHASRYWRPYFGAAQKRVESWGGAEGQVLVLSVVSGNVSVALASAARQAGIPVFVVEHGASAGLSRFHEPLRPFSEVSRADVFLACSPNAVRFNDEDETLRGKSVAVGLARQIRRAPGPLWRAAHRKRLAAGGSGRVVMYLTRACQNNLRFLPFSPEDRDVHAVERVMVLEVMPFVRGVPVIKFYNTRRHPDGHPFTGPFKAGPPVVTRQAGDFRFLRAGVDAIVMQSPMSTLGWALGTDRPLFYLEQPELEILPRVRGLFSESVFLFSTREPDWGKRLLESLNRPDGEISADWDSRAKARKEFSRECVFGPENPGRNAAQAILG